MATKIILFSTPFFFLLIFIEIIVDRVRKSNVYRLNDAITSLSLGVISQTKRLVFFSFAAIIYAWLADNLLIPQLSADSALVWVFSFILYDFLYYWFHRFSHQINFLWASHVVHHQSEEYNLTTALRQTSSNVFGWLFYIPSFVLGVPAEVFFVSGALNLVYQFWVHTRLVGRLGWLEQILVTPSHHRVHHGQNQVYIDKNHGGVFIVWDKLFGTFQAELDTEEVIYGVRRPLSSFNPLWANIHTWVSLIKDAFRAKHWFDKLRIWFMPTGWRPDDVNQDYPLVKRSPKDLIKYDPKSSGGRKVYAVIQYSFAVIFAVIFIQFTKELDFSPLLTFWLLITLPLITIGTLLEGNSRALQFETIRIILSVTLLMAVDYLYGIPEPLLVLIVPNFLVSIIGISMISFSENRKTKIKLE